MRTSLIFCFRCEIFNLGDQVVNRFQVPFGSAWTRGWGGLPFGIGEAKSFWERWKFMNLEMQQFPLPKGGLVQFSSQLKTRSPMGSSANKRTLKGEKCKFFLPSLLLFFLFKVSLVAILRHGNLSCSSFKECFLFKEAPLFTWKMKSYLLFVLRLFL